MKRKLQIVFIALALFGTFNSYIKLTAAENLVDSLSTIDPEMRKYFPRWRVCEPDIQFQIYKAFEMLGYNKSKLNIQQIEILAAPQSPKDKFFEILLVSCGEESMNTRVMDAEIKQIVRYLSGQNAYRPENQALKGNEKKFERDYCYTEIPPETPVSATQATIIVDYFQPTNVRQALSLSLFEQSLKIGKTDFSLRSKVGNDEVGYPFWYNGEGKIVMQRPLYKNTDVATYGMVPNLINAYLGGSYRTTSGLEPSSLFSFVSTRTLNMGPGGRFVGGLDVHMPFYPTAGIHLNVELPLNKIENEGIDFNEYGKYVKPELAFNDGDSRTFDTQKNKLVTPIMRSSGQVTLFYNWWVNPESPEDYFRFDLGLSYLEVQEHGIYSGDTVLGGDRLVRSNVIGVSTFKPSEFGDWVYAKMEYRNQSTFPFGFSLQYSNQILLARAYMPLIGNWFLLEGKYSSPLRGARPYEITNYFMISPVFRITI